MTEEELITYIRKIAGEDLHSVKVSSDQGSCYVSPVLTVEVSVVLKADHAHAIEDCRKSLKRFLDCYGTAGVDFVVDIKCYPHDGCEPEENKSEGIMHRPDADWNF